MPKRRIHLRYTHPNMYNALTTFSIIRIALAVNFFFSHPTFNPYDIPKDLIGVIFLTLGLIQLLFLNVWKDLRGIRLIQTISIGFTFFWGIANTQQFFQGNASLQLPIMYLGFCATQIPWLIESPINPMTRREQ